MMQESSMMTVKFEFSINTVELEVKYLYNHLNATGICLRTSFNFKIRTNHRPQKWDGNTTKYWRLAHRQNYKKIAILIVIIIVEFLTDLTLKMASAHVVETSVTNNSPSQDSNHPDDLFQSRNKRNYLSCVFLVIKWQGWPSGESTCLPPMWPGFDFRTRCHMWIEFVGPLLCCERFSPGYSGFPLPSKTSIWFDFWILIVK